MILFDRKGDVCFSKSLEKTDDRKSVVLTVEDGGPADADGTKNGVVIFTMGIDTKLKTIQLPFRNLEEVDSSNCFISILGQ